MPTVLDQTQDLDGRELLRLSQQYTLPPFCKQASSADVVGLNSEPASNYAYPPRQLYPCHTAAATYVSQLFFLDKQASFKDAEVVFIQTQLDKYAKYFGISDRVDGLKRAWDANKIPDETVLTDDDFALLMDGRRHYPLRNGLEVKAAATFMKTNGNIIPLSYRQKMASRILDKADRFAVNLGELDDYLQKQAGNGYCDAETIADFLFGRARLLKIAGKLDAAIEVGKLAKTAMTHKSAIHDFQLRRELAAIVDRIDREQGLTTKIACLVPPEDVFFQITEKDTVELREEHVSSPSGNIYKKADFDKLKLDDVRDFMGDDFANAVETGSLFVSAEKLAAIVPTLPRSDAQLFDKMLVTLGVTPAAKEAGAPVMRFGTQELVALASMKS